MERSHSPVPCRPFPLRSSRFDESPSTARQYGSVVSRTDQAYIVAMHYLHSERERISCPIEEFAGVPEGNLQSLSSSRAS